MTFPSAPELLGGLHPLHPYRGAFSLACENRRGSITLPMLEEFLQVQQQDEACSWSIASVPGQFTGPTATVLSARRHSNDHRIYYEQSKKLGSPLSPTVPQSSSASRLPPHRRRRRLNGAKPAGFLMRGAVGAMTLMRG
jgi:hypothetical protein